SPEDPAGIAAHDEQRLAQDVLDALFGLGRLQSIIDDPDVENIDINGCDRVWVTYSDGRKEMVEPVADSDEELVELVKSAATRFGLSERRFDLARPQLDLRLPDGSRLSALMAVCVRPAVSVRRHRFTELSLDDLVALGTMDEDLSSFLAASVRARKNLVVAGAMNSGKTTLLRALASEIPPHERLVTIEQAFELGLDSDVERHPDIVALEARPANIEGEGQITVADLVRRALRMNADRVIVGEVLGDEVLPMLNAMSQGRSGSMCTIHADSSAGVFRRIASYAVQAPERLPVEASNLLVAGAVNFVVFLDSDEDPCDPAAPREVLEADHAAVPAPSRGPRRRISGFAARPRSRFVSSVREVVDAEGAQVVSNEVYAPGPDRRAVPAAPLRPATAAELARSGYAMRRQAFRGIPA
ncbi:MAG TPA: ATPase, T2SS/T4P/T4SS family, partial [Acidimicrobiales bacterium]|nr:ATPase, T2SS/T4P/T4SS family [Acidimicrobiales bacterium]